MARRGNSSWFTSYQWYESHDDVRYSRVVLSLSGHVRLAMAAAAGTPLIVVSTVARLLTSAAETR